MRPAALTGREIWKKKARNIHGYTTYIPYIYVKRYTTYIHGYTTYKLGRYTWYIHGYTMYIHYCDVGVSVSARAGSEQLRRGSGASKRPALGLPAAVQNEQTVYDIIYDVMI